MTFRRLLPGLAANWDLDGVDHVDLTVAWADPVLTVELEGFDLDTELGAPPRGGTLDELLDAVADMLARAGEDY